MSVKNLYDITNKFKERDIQKLFSKPKVKPKVKRLLKKERSNIFGLPDYLLDAQVLSNNQAFKACFKDLKYIYRPDCICRNNKNIYIIELKRADKFEPLGIPEVLHHVELQERKYPKKNIIPVFIGSFNMWSRVAVNRLLKAKINFLYYELYILSYHLGSNKNTVINKNHFLWFYNPFLKGCNWDNPFESSEEKNNQKKISYTYNFTTNSDNYFVEDIPL